MSRSRHPDDVEIDDDFVVSEVEQIVIEHYCPAASAERLAHVIRAQAERLCLAAGKDWDRNWYGTWDPEAGVGDRHVAFLTVAAAFARQCLGDTPVIRDWNDLVAEHGPPEGIFRPRRWPSDVIPGALVLENA